MRTCLVLALCLSGPLSAVGQDTLAISVRAAPVWNGPIELVEEVRIGALDGAEYEVFGRIAGVVGMGDGTTVVADAQGPALYQFDPTGQFVRRVGGQGGGPGEYLRLNAISALPEDRFAIQDARAGKGIVYGGDGGVEAEFPLRSGLNSIFPTFATDQHDRAYVRVVDRVASAPPPSQATTGWTYVWIRVDLDGTVLDTLRVPPAEPEGPQYTIITAEGPRFPYTVETLSAVSPAGYLVWGRNDRYAVFRKLPDGRVVRISRDVEQIDVTSSERRQFEQISADFERRGDAEYPDVPDKKPYFRSLQADVDGRIWVERYTAPYRYEYGPEERERLGDRPPLEWRELQVFDVFEPQGQFLGSVQLPDRTRLAFARGSRIWTVEWGPYNEPYVVRYRLQPAG